MKTKSHKPIKELLEDARKDKKTMKWIKSHSQETKLKNKHLDNLLRAYHDTTDAEKVAVKSYSSPDISKEQELTNEQKDYISEGFKRILKDKDAMKYLAYSTKMFPVVQKLNKESYQQGRKDAIEDEIRFLIRLRRKANIKFGLIGFIEMIDNRIKEKELQC